MEQKLKDLKRAIRRVHTKRLAKKREYYWGYGKPLDQVKHCVFLGIDLGWVNELSSVRGVSKMDAHQKSRVVQNSQSCSCYGCSGNYERRHFGRMSLKEASFIALEESVTGLTIK